MITTLAPTGSMERNGLLCLSLPLSGQAPPPPGKTIPANKLEKRLRKRNITLHLPHGEPIRGHFLSANPETIEIRKKGEQEATPVPAAQVDYIQYRRQLGGWFAAAGLGLLCGGYFVLMGPGVSSSAAELAGLRMTKASIAMAIIGLACRPRITLRLEPPAPAAPSEWHSQ